MAIVVINPRFYPFLNELVAECERSGAPLSDDARQLLALAVESWMEDSESLAVRRPGVSTEQLRGLARDMLNLALVDQHVEGARRNREPVSFGSMLVALGVAGRRILRPLLDKGFLSSDEQQ